MFAFLLYLAWIPAGSLLSVSQSNPIESLSFGFLFASQKKPNLAQELCVTVTCVHISTAHVPSFMAKQLSYFFWINLIRKWLKFSVTSSIPLLHSALECQKLHRQNALSQVTWRQCQCIGDPCWESFDQEAAAKQWKRQSSGSRVIFWINIFIFFINSSTLTQSTCSQIIFHSLDRDTITVKG